jgi:hypothetical protein
VIDYGWREMGRHPDTETVTRFVARGGLSDGNGR